MKRSAPIKRSAPPKRTTRVKQKRATKRRRPEGTHDEAYKAAVRALPCFSCGKAAPSEPDHMGERGLGQKAPDSTCVPMCGGPHGCHRRRTDGYLWSEAGGFWYRVNAEYMRAWCRVAIKYTRERLGYVEVKDA